MLAAGIPWPVFNTWVVRGLGSVALISEHYKRNTVIVISSYLFRLSMIVSLYKTMQNLCTVYYT